MPPIRLGAIGCGHWASTVHFAQIQQVADLKLVALCDIDANRLAVVASRFGVADTFTRFEEMLDSGQVDAVSVIGPPFLHVAAAKACLKRQIPFLVEKPLALTVAEARELVELAERYGDCGQVGYTSRFAPAQRLAWRISRLAGFGPISYVATTHLTKATISSRAWGLTSRAETLVHLHGVHAIDLWRFFGGDPIEVSASVVGLGETDGHESACGSVLAYVRAAGGPHGTIHMKAGASHNGDINADVMGIHSRVRVENDQHLEYESGRDWADSIMQDDLLPDTFLADQPAGHFLRTGMISHTYDDFFRYEWTAFVRSLLAGKPFSPSIHDGYKTVCLTEAICASISTGFAPQKVTY